MKVTETVKGKRRRWWEMFEEREQYVGRYVKKKELLQEKNLPLLLDILRLPADFTCFQCTEAISMEDRVERAISIALHSQNGALEFDLVEVDWLLLTRISRAVNEARRKSPAVREGEEKW